jgi:hypothetical protein
MGEVQGRDRGLADIGVEMPGQRAEPGIDALTVSTMQVKSRPCTTFSISRSFSSARGGPRPRRDRGGDIGRARDIGAELLQRHVGIRALLAASLSTSVDCSLVITSFRIAATDLRLANHWRRMRATMRAASVLSSRIARVAPAILEGQAVQLVEDPGRGGGGKARGASGVRRCAVAQPGLEPAGERLIGQQRVEMHRHLGHAHALARVEMVECR